MASGVGKHKLLLGPTEPWSIREKLCLASSVWVSVSRAIKPFAEPGRPPDWFSQKHCASQYSELLETTEAPKRKRGEKGEVVETVEDVIVRRLTAERIEELKRLIKDTQEKHRKLKRETELIQAGHLDSKLEELWEEIVRSRKQEEEEAEVKRKATDAAYQARQAVKNTPKRVPSVTVRSPSGACSPSLDFPIGDPSEDPSTTGAGSTVFVPLTELPGPGVVEASLGSLLDESTQKKLLGQKITPPPSPLLSELLKKGSLLPTSPRLPALSVHRVCVLYAVPHLCLYTCVSGAPTLSRLLEAGPAQFPSQLSSLATADSAPTTAASTLDTEVKEEEEAVSDAEEGSVSAMKAGLEGDGVEDCGGEEDGDLSEPEGETELDPPASESEDGYSMHTASSSVQLHTTADSIPSSPASSQFSICSEDQEAIQAQKIWKKAIMLVWRAAANHRYANVFLQPVTDDIAPGYRSIVHRPMDLSTIKKNIENGLIRTTAEFQRDIMLMFQNAVMYNSSDHDVFHMAVEMQRDVLEQIQQFLATQLIMQTSESGISAKSLRGRDANRKQDPSDKVGHFMCHSTFTLLHISSEDSG
uniref:Bromodomain-containing protein 8 n=1 Tax=Sinocyclocheilus grahami TaxID=75366 RepID=A0A672JX45_SINGR